MGTYGNLAGTYGMRIDVWRMGLSMAYGASLNSINTAINLLSCPCCHANTPLRPGALPLNELHLVVFLSQELYELCGHVYLNPRAKHTVIDLR
jgi:hypothetical protein